MNSFEVRKKFAEFFLNNQHHILPSSSLIPDKDPSLLFVNAGMNQFKNVFLGSKPLKDIFSFSGLKAPAEPNVVTIQKCLRAGGKHNDLENVGETPFHHTFFEMLGNFSFGAYFKKTAIALAWEFLTQELKIPAENLWVSVHEKDEESFKIWEKKIPKHKIFRLGDKDNFWQMGETGPCGFCAEIHYFKGKSPQPKQLTEIWNLVFMEFYDKENGAREKLSVPCVDTGMGLERLCSILQNKKSNYHTDIFSEIILNLEKASSSKYDFEEKKQTEQQKAFRVLADHSRAICFLIADDVIPGNEKESYVLRRIIRRALYYSQKLHPEKNLLQIAVEKTLTLMAEVGDLFNQDNNLALAGKAYLSLKGEGERIQSIIEGETKKFFDSLKEGKKQLEKIMKTHSALNELNNKLLISPAKKQLALNKEKEQKQSSKETRKTSDSSKNNKKQLKKAEKAKSKTHLKESEVWNLYSTYGFPIDLTRLIAKEKSWTIPSDLEMKQYIKKEKTDSTNHKAEETYLKEQKRLQEKSQLNLPIYIKTRRNLISKIGLTKFLNQQAPYLVPIIKNKIEKTNFIGYETNQATGQIVFMGLFPLLENTNAKENKLQSPSFYSTNLSEGAEDWIVLDKTCFYPEGGGPIGDKGLLKTETGQAEVLDCQKIDELIWMKIKVIVGDLKKDQNCKMEVYKNYRQGIKSHHTATHLLNSALRKILGNSVRQKGSLVEPYFLRFDFSHPQALTPKQITEVEKQVLDSINQSEEVVSSYKSFEQAREENYIYLKGENYPSQARVLKIGKDRSKELCGGVHVKNTSEIESFKIIKEEGVGSGVRRITAYAGSSLKAWEDFLIKHNLELREFLHQANLNLPADIKDSQNEQQNKTRLTLSLNKSFKKIIENGVQLWQGEIEKENPFLKAVKEKEKSLKLLRKKIVTLDTKQSEKESHLYSSNASSVIPTQPKTQLNQKNQNTNSKRGREFITVKKTFHPLAKQTLELRDFLNLPLPKIKEGNNFKTILFTEENPQTSNSLFLDFFRNKKEDIDNLKSILKEIKNQELNLENLRKKVKEFNIKDTRVRLLVLPLPLDDRKILSDLSDFALSQLNLSVLILFGESQTDKHPVLVNLNKSFTSILSAGDILKNDIAPLMNGRGGGKPHFSQGSIQDRTKINELDSLLIKKWS